jgi:hypothetical protein
VPHKPKNATWILSKKAKEHCALLIPTGDKNMSRTLAIGSALGTAALLGIAMLSALSVTPAHACKTCETVVLVCGDRTFVGGSNIGTAEDIARILARRAGKDPDNCIVRSR